MILRTVQFHTEGPQTFTAFATLIEKYRENKTFTAKINKGTPEATMCNWNMQLFLAHAENLGLKQTGHPKITK